MNDEQDVAVEIEDVVVPGPIDADDTGIDEQRKLTILKALAIRSTLGTTERLPLNVPGFGKLDDPQYYIVFNDPTADAVDAFQDAMNQVRSVDNMQVDEESGQVVGEQMTERTRRLWPMLEVIMQYGIIAEASLPRMAGNGTMAAPFVWKQNAARNRQQLKQGKFLTLETLVFMAADHILGSEANEVMDELGG